jgi:hypothetical protein
VRLEEPSHPVHIAMRVGSTVSLLETATGRILAAFLPQATIRTALRDGLDRLSIGYDPEREIEGPAVDKTLDDIRSRGLARAVGDPLRASTPSRRRSTTTAAPSCWPSPPLARSARSTSTGTAPSRKP